MAETDFPPRCAADSDEPVAPLGGDPEVPPRDERADPRGGRPEPTYSPSWISPLVCVRAASKRFATSCQFAMFQNADT